MTPDTPLDASLDADTADVAEQRTGAAGDPAPDAAAPDVDALPVDAPLPDAAEQHTEASGEPAPATALPDVAGVPVDVPEADALEQAQLAGSDEDDERRD